MSSSQQHQRRRRQRRSTASVVATTAATAAVAYGTYRLAQWYWDEDEESKEGTEHPLEEDLPAFSAQQQSASDNRNQNGDQSSSNHRSNNSTDNFSWLSSAAVGVASWLADGSTSFPGSPASFGNNNGFAPRTSTARSRPRRTRRQNLIRCRNQTRVAFHACLQTIKPALEKLTDSSRQTKELKALRKRRQALKQNGQDQQEIEESTEGASASPVETTNKTEYERELQKLQEQEKEMWREILVKTTTRMMASSYAYTLLLLSLTVQFHWLASTSEFHPDSIEEQQREQEALLMQSHRYFLNEGMPLLVSTIRRSVENVLFGDDNDEEPNGGKIDNKSSSHWRNPSSQFVSSEDVEEMLYRQLPRVLDDIGMGTRRRRRRRNWIRFVLPDEEVFDPVRDICKSPVWEDAQEQVLGYLWYKVLRDGQGNSKTNSFDTSSGWGKIFRANGKINGPYSDNNDGREQGKTQLQQQPLAKAMTLFKKAASALFDETVENEDGGDMRSSTVGRLQTLPMVLELGDITFQ